MTQESPDMQQGGPALAHGATRSLASHVADVADVAIIGAGPVGLVLATDLAQRGHRVVIVETRHRGEPPSVKCNHVSARTMESLRRLGIADRVRAAGLPDDFPHDVVFRTSVTGLELSRIHIPGRATRLTDKSGPDGWWPTAEPPHRINQTYFEPILFEHAAAQPGVTIVNRCEATAIAQDDDGVVVEARHLDGGGSLRINARFLVGCDGGRSMVRKTAGLPFSGTPVIQNVQSTYIRAPELLDLIPGQPAWSTYASNPRRRGVCFAIDGRETWLVHNHLRVGETFDDVDRDAGIRNILGVDADFAYEMLASEDWIGRRLVAERLRDRRIFIAGDAAHLWVPIAGYGMNAGIADALNLSWALSSHLAGWAGPAMLDAYEAERQPITDQVSRFAMDFTQQAIKKRDIVPPNIEDAGPEGDAVRAAEGRENYDINVQQFCCAGLNFGYFYERSPVIAYDGEAPPAFSMGSFTPATVPGCRAPHIFFARAPNEGRSLYDAFGPGYTLLRVQRSVDPQPLLDAAAAAGVPMQLLDLDGEDLPPEYRHALVLCRPDQHVAWRGDSVPADAGALVELLRGAAAGPA